jgi:murein DD-endopeptidase
MMNNTEPSPAHFHFPIRMFRIFAAVTIITILAVLASPVSLEAARYRIRKGDTLADIAARHGTTVWQLKKRNGLKSNRIKAGHTLVLPGRKVRKRKSRSRTARYNKFKQRKQASRKSKKAHYRKSWDPRFPPEQHAWVKGKGPARILTPPDYRPPQVQHRNINAGPYSVHLYAQRFARGNACYMEIHGNGSSLNGLKVWLNGRPIPLTSRSWGKRALIAFSAAKHYRRNILTIQHKKKRKFSVTIEDTPYPVKVWRHYAGNLDKKVHVSPDVKARRAARAAERRALIRRSSRKLKKVYKRRSQDRLTARTSHPRGFHRITSTFYNNRKRIHWYRKNGRAHYKKPYFTRHDGLDLAGKTGSPIYALADGLVVCSQKMYYEGNYTVIDHGNGIFSGYMHQSNMVLKEGSRVKAGQVLGKVGTTGRVTGPHLHVNLKVRGKPVHPLSILGLPIR